MERSFSTEPIGVFFLKSVAAALVFLMLGASAALPARAQEIAKYGAEFLAGGVGARAIGMGGAQVGLAADVTAGYWNGAGLSRIAYPEIAYMHVERFAGVVSFDYAGGALPVNERSTVGLSFFRSGVNDIVNTLSAWNPDLGQPRPDYLSRITRFSAADYAFFLTYARSVSEKLAVGLTGKIIRRGIGDFADAWGYSFDLGVQYRTERFALGANLQDLSTMMQSWSINPDAFSVDCADSGGAPFEACIDPETGQAYESNADRYRALFDQRMPEGGTELVLPVARLGAGTMLPVAGASEVTLGLDMDVFFDGRGAYAASVGDVSFEPRLGAEFDYRGVVALRGGISRVQYGEDLGLSLTPSVGAGLRLAQFSVDYAFGDFAGASRDLGFSHRISAQLRLEQPRLKRGD